MRIAYTTTFNARDVHNWSGTPYHMSKALEDNGFSVNYVGSLKRCLPPGFKIKKALKQFLFDQRESPRFNCHAAIAYSRQVETQLKKMDTDIIVSPLINPVAYLECKQPIVLWTDAVYAALLGFYPPFAYHSANSVHQGNAITEACLSRCKLAIFSSEWAANTAAALYGVDKEKLHVVPYGANISNYPDYESIQTIIKNKQKNKIKLLFLAKSWERKGGLTVLAVTRALHEAGHPIELAIVGVSPRIPADMPYVTSHGFISKETAEGRKKILDLLNESHFLFLPSRADACPMVFAEANAYGLPCLSTYVGGISTAIKNNINGMTFPVDASVSRYCDYITNTVYNEREYTSLALSSYNEYETRLNWTTAANKVKSLFTELL